MMPTTVILLYYSNLVTSSDYRWVLPISESKICSLSPECERQIEGRLANHTFCQKSESLRNDTCSYVTLSDSSRLTYLLGVNGIRNEIALDWKISNMNKVHWSRILQRMSERFLLQCSMDLDECAFLGTPSYNVSICQNVVNILSTEEDKNPYGYAVRKWYSEFVTKKSESSFEEFEHRLKETKGRENITNFSQMIWPTLELMGCASTRTHNGIIVTCFFFPRVTGAEIDDYVVGHPCQNCQRNRPTCSAYFKGLCGIDKQDEISGSDFTLERISVLFLVFIAFVR